MTSLSNRRALVTGASSGIGARTAIHVARGGADVFLVGRDRARLENTAAECPRSTVIVLDVRDADAVERELSKLACDLVVNNAGMALGADKLPLGDAREWSTVIDTNVKGVLHVAQATLQSMARAGRGDHVFLELYLGFYP